MQVEYTVYIIIFKKKFKYLHNELHDFQQTKYTFSAWKRVMTFRVHTICLITI